MEKINDLFEESTTKAVEDIKDSSIEDLSALCNKLLRAEGEIGNRTHVVGSVRLRLLWSSLTIVVTAMAAVGKFISGE